MTDHEFGGGWTQIKLEVLADISLFFAVSNRPAIPVATRIADYILSRA